MRHAPPTSVHLLPATRVYARKGVLLSGTSTSICSLLFTCTTIGLGSCLPVFLFMHLLRGALSLVVEFHILRGDLGLTILGFPASAGAVSH